jgi:hypothetical protein
MAPEVVASGFEEADKTYDSRIDVWALGEQEQSLVYKNWNVLSCINKNKNVMMRSRNNEAEERMFRPRSHHSDIVLRVT